MANLAIMAGASSNPRIVNRLLERELVQMEPRPFAVFPPFAGVRVAR
jgi:hypothetical protein